MVGCAKSGILWKALKCVGSLWDKDIYALQVLKPYYLFLLEEQTLISTILQ